jgi:hypothetical protein
LKYSLQTAAQTVASQQEQESWTQLQFVNSNRPEAAVAKEKLVCKNMQNFIELNVTTEQLMNLT